MLRNSIRDTETAALAGAIGLFGVGLLLNYYIVLYAGGMTGAGHGIFMPVLLTCPRVWIIMSPFLIAGANTGWLRVRVFAKALVCVYYVWLLFHLSDLLQLQGEYYRIADQLPGVFWTWASLVLLTHALIWLPVPVIRLYRKRLARKPEQNLTR